MAEGLGEGRSVPRTELAKNFTSGYIPAGMADQQWQQRHGKRAGKPALSGAGSAASFAGLGIQLAISILLFLYLGQWLDKKLGTDPLLLIVGVFVGATVGIYNMYHVLTAAQRKEQKERGK